VRFKKTASGFTLIELMMVVTIVGLLASIATPKFALVFTKAHQAKSKGNLGSVRSAISMYQSANEGVLPLHGYAEGDSYYTDLGVSLSSILAPTYIPVIPTPKFYDGVWGFNGTGLQFDSAAENLMQMNPPKDIYIIWGDPDFTPLLVSPYAYDSRTGLLYYPNGNVDTTNHYFYTW
jgi:prepilin-type N-terminal cleavage/methylation domain-containing protein